MSLRQLRWDAAEGNMSKLAGWYGRRVSPRPQLTQERLLSLVRDVGSWLAGKDYVGSDVKAEYPAAELSTALGFAMVGWIELFALLKEPRLVEHAEECLERLLESQTGEGAWPFPYPFGENPAGLVYACETFMTLRSLLHYVEFVEEDERVVESIRRGLDHLVAHVGYEGGVFWYSAADRIVVPNISSMAANVFARAHRLLGREELLEKAQEFAAFCVQQQRQDGAYPYFGLGTKVYIPYHALEIWELQETNEVLADEELRSSVRGAIEYLTRYLRDRGYRSTDIDDRWRTVLLFKTPLWAAKAYLATGDMERAIHHLARSLQLFQIPGEPQCFYMLQRIGSRRIGLERPMMSTTFMRYNASLFEIGSKILSTRVEDRANRAGNAA